MSDRLQVRRRYEGTQIQIHANCGERSLMITLETLRKAPCLTPLKDLTLQEPVSSSVEASHIGCWFPAISWQGAACSHICMIISPVPGELLQNNQETFHLLGCFSTFFMYFDQYCKSQPATELRVVDVYGQLAVRMLQS